MSLTAPLEQLLAQPEGKQLEFKRDLSSPQPLLKTLVAFANTAGGQHVIEEIANRLRITIPLSQIHSVAQPPEPVTQSDNDYLLLRLLRNGPMASSELREAMNLKPRKYFRAHQLDPALAQGQIEMTIPDKPNSRLQKYRLTPAGAELIKDMP